MDNQDLSRQVIEIPLASDGSAKLTLRGSTVEELVGHLAAAEVAIDKITRSARRIIVACCMPAASGEVQS